MTDNPLDRIKAIVGSSGYLTDISDIDPHLRETRGLFHGATKLIVRPANTAELAAVVTICAEARIPVVPQGGNTGRCGGAVPSEDGNNIMIETGRMNRIRSINPANFTMTVEAGCILADIQNAASEADRLFPLSLGAEGSCQIGGNISTNAGGVQVLRYGNTRDLVLGIEVVLPDGRIWDGLRTLRKDNTGYDLKQLFIGGEGTLGIITAASLRLFPKPKQVATAFVGLPGIDRVMTLFSMARTQTGDQLISFELIPRIGLEFALNHINGVVDPLALPYADYALIEIASSDPEADSHGILEKFLSHALDSGLIKDATLASSEAQRLALWHIRENIVEAQKFEGASIKHDVSVPVADVAAFVTEATVAVKARLPSIRPMPFGHVGDGNIHFNLSQPEDMDSQAFLARWEEFNDIVHGIVAKYHGSISAEHGIGRLKRNEIVHYKSGIELELMARIKRAIDPEGLMNPGKLLPDTFN